MDKSLIKDTKTTQTRLVLPPDTNHLDTIFGGKILAYIDEIAALTAMKHAKSAVVTASIDSVDFLSSAKVGDSLTLEAYVTYRSEEHTSELQSRGHLVCRLPLGKKK